VIINCSYEAIPLGERIWERINLNGVTIKIDSSYSDKYQIAVNGSLVISMASDEDNGGFVCTAKNVLGNVSKVVHLIVISKCYNKPKK